MNEFLQQLKQRKLVQWAIAYVAAAFASLKRDERSPGAIVDIKPAFWESGFR